MTDWLGRAKVVVIQIPDDRLAWDVLNAASEQEGVQRAIMVDDDNPYSIEQLLREPI